MLNASRGVFMTDIKSIRESTKSPQHSRHHSHIVFSSVSRRLPQMQKPLKDRQSEKALGVFCKSFTQALGLEKKVHFSDSSYRKGERRKLEYTFTEKFLENQVRRVENEVEKVYFRPMDLNRNIRLKSVEGNHALTEMVGSQKLELLRLKKVFNEFEVKLAAEAKNIESLKQIRDGIEESDELKVETPKSEEPAETPEFLMNAQLEFEVLERLNQNNKIDIILVKKKNEIFKRWLQDIQERTIHIRKDLERQNMGYRMRLKGIRNRSSNFASISQPFVASTIKEEYSLFVENVEASRVIREEERKFLQQKQLEEEALNRELEDQRRRFRIDHENHIKLLENLRIKLNKTNAELAEVMAIVRASCKGDIIDEIYEAYASKDSLDQLSQKYLRNSAKKRFFRENRLEEAFYSENEGTETPKNKNIIKPLLSPNMVLEDIERQIKEKSNELERIKIQGAKSQNTYFEACDMFSRLMFKINPSMSKNITTQGSNALDVMTNIGLQLEKIMNICHSQGQNVNRDTFREDYANKRVGKSSRLDPYGSYLSSYTPQEVDGPSEIYLIR